MEKPERFLEFAEPHVTGGVCVIRISEGNAIAYQKRVTLQRGGGRITDKQALEDFMAVHWAKFVEQDVNIDRTSAS